MNGSSSSGKGNQPSRTTQNAPCYHLVSPPPRGGRPSQVLAYPGAVTGAPVAAWSRSGDIHRCAEGRCAAPRPCSAASSAPVSTLRALCGVPHRVLFSSLPLHVVELCLVYAKNLPPSTGKFAVNPPASSGEFGAKAHKIRRRPGFSSFRSPHRRPMASARRSTSSRVRR